jgi:hypothetical protein
MMIRTMTDLAKRLPRGQRVDGTTAAEPAADGRAGEVPAISPQEFYQELVAQQDVRRILTRLAQVEDVTAPSPDGC